MRTHTIRHILQGVWGDRDIMATSSKREEEEEQQGENGYWRNELYSLGILDPIQKRKEEAKDSKAELENLANIIKQAMFEDYKLAYSEERDVHKEEAESTITVG